MLSDMGGIINPDIEKIAKFCKEKNIILLEDAAHSFGSTLNNKFAGTFGDAGVYSYYSTKAVFAGEGGVGATGRGLASRPSTPRRKVDNTKPVDDVGVEVFKPTKKVLAKIKQKEVRKAMTCTFSPLKQQKFPLRIAQRSSGGTRK